MTQALLSGLLLGLSAGLSPGPLMTLVVAQSMRHGAREGCKVALAPLLTDAPIILVALAAAARASELRFVMGCLSLAGGLFVLYLAADTFRPVRIELAKAQAPPRSWFKGVTVNLLNPNPWLFWMTVGAASLAQALGTGWLAVVAFLGPFYALLVGSKLLLAVLTGQSRDFLAGRPYRIILRILGVLLAVFAALLFRAGWNNFFAASAESR